MKFVKTSILIAFVLLAPALTPAQEAKPIRILLVPFEEVMFISDINDTLAEASGLPPNELRNSVRLAITHATADVGGPPFEIINLLTGTSPHYAAALQKIFFNLSRSYSAIPDHPRHFRKQSDGSYLEIPDSLLNSDERLGLFRDRMERFLKSEITGDETIVWLQTQFAFDYVVLLNQLDLVQTENDLTHEPTGDRLLRLHYSILDASGNPITGGVSRVTFPYSENNLWILSTTAFPACGAQVWERIWEIIPQR